MSMVAWALGFATGTYVGIALEQWIGTGSVLVRVISRSHADNAERAQRRGGADRLFPPLSHISSDISWPFAHLQAFRGSS